MFLHLFHKTAFHYDGSARSSFNEVRLRPVDDDVQTCRSFALRVSPDVAISDYPDFHGNTVHYFEIATDHQSLVIEAESEVETVPDAGRRAVPAVSTAELAASPEREMHAEFCTDSRYVPLAPELWREAQDALATGRSDVWNDVIRIAGHVYGTIAYKTGATGIGTMATDALAIRAGVCQDFAHVTLGLCRCIGIPARYVSGYFLNEDRRPGKTRRPTPGSKRSSRDTDGRLMIPHTPAGRTNGTSKSRSAAIMRTSRPSAGLIAERRRENCSSMSKCARRPQSRRNPSAPAPGISR